MRPESLPLLREAARINPLATVKTIANEKSKYAEALFDLTAHDRTGNAVTWTPGDWEAVLTEMDADDRTLTQFLEARHARS